MPIKINTTMTFEAVKIYIQAEYSLPIVNLHDSPWQNNVFNEGRRHIVNYSRLTPYKNYPECLHVACL